MMIQVKSDKFLELVIGTDVKWNLNIDAVGTNICSEIFVMNNFKKYFTTNTFLISLSIPHH